MKKILVLLLCLLCLSACTSEKQTEVKDDNTSDKQSEVKDYKNANSIADFAGAKLAGQAGTIHEELASQIECASFTNYPTVPEELVALKSKAVDGFVCEEPQAISICEGDDTVTYIKLVNNDNGFVTSVEQSGLAIGLAKDSELTKKINEIFQEANFDSTAQSALMAEMVKINLGQDVDLTTLQYEDVSDPVGTLKVGMECDSAPYNWTDVDTTTNNYPISGKDGYYCNGYDVQVSRYIAYKLNMNLEIYAYEWDSLIPAVKSGAIDCIIAGMSPTSERAKQIDFTDVYYDTNFVIVVNK